MVDLFSNWNCKKLEELIDDKTIGLVKGAKEQDDNFEYDYVKMHNISNQNSWNPFKIAKVNATESEVEKFNLQDNDLLFNTRNSFELVGKSCLFKSVSNQPVLFNNNIMRIRFGSEIDQRFAAHAFSSPDVLRQLEKMKQGTTNVSAIYFKTLKTLKIRFPPISEQIRIVAILDQVFADIEKARTTAETNLKNITSKIGSGATPRGGKEAYKDVGMSLIRSMNIHDRVFKEKNLALIDDEQAAKLNNVELLENDILLNITGASVARCCVIPKEVLPGRVNQHVSIIRVDKSVIEPSLLCFLLTSKFYKDKLLGIGESGSTRQAITKVQIENFEIVFPKGLDEQKKLLKDLESLELKMLKLQDIYIKKSKRLVELKSSILQKAFTGELTKSKGIAA